MIDVNKKQFHGNETDGIVRDSLRVNSKDIPRKDFVTLAIESSCDESSASILRGERNLLSNVISSQIANYIASYKGGFEMCAAFDVKENLIGKKMNGYEILDNEDLVDYVEENKIDIGIICVNKENAQAVADRLTFAGVKGIWNFAPLDLEVPERVAVENVHLSDSLHSLAYHIKDIEKANSKKTK